MGKAGPCGGVKVLRQLAGASVIIPSSLWLTNWADERLRCCTVRVAVTEDLVLDYPKSENPELE